MEKKSSGAKVYGAYFIALILFGTNGVLASHISLISTQIVLLRTGLGSLLLASLFFLRRGHFSIRQNKKAYGYLTFSGAMMGASWMFLYEAYRYVGVGIASLCMYSSLILVMIASVILFREPLSLAKGLAFGVACLGTLLVNGSALAGSLSPYGLLLGMASCWAYAAMILSAKMAPNLPNLEKSTWQVICAFLTTAVFCLFRKELIFTLPSGQWGWILTLGLVNTGLGCYLYFSSIGRLPAQTIAICDNLELLSAVLSSALFLGERLSPLQTLGAGLILAGAVSAAAVKAPSRRPAMAEAGINQHPSSFC